MLLPFFPCLSVTSAWLFLYINLLCFWLLGNGMTGSKGTPVWYSENDTRVCSRLVSLKPGNWTGAIYVSPRILRIWPPTTTQNLLFFPLPISQWESSWNHVSLLRNTRYSLLPMECWGLLVSQGWRWYIFSHSPKVLQFSSWEGRSKGQRDPRLTRWRESIVSSFSLSQRGKRLPPCPLFSLLSCIFLSFVSSSTPGLAVGYQVSC